MHRGPGRLDDGPVVAIQGRQNDQPFVLPRRLFRGGRGFFELRGLLEARRGAAEGAAFVSNEQYRNKVIGELSASIERYGRKERSMMPS